MRGRVFYARKSSAGTVSITPRLPDDTAPAVRQQLEEIAERLLVSPTQNVLLILGHESLENMKESRAAVITDPRASLKRFAKIYHSKHVEANRRHGAGLVPIPRPQIPSDARVKASVLWFVPLVDDEQALFEPMSHVARLFGDVPDFVKQLMAEWDPLAVMWLVSDDATRGLVREVHSHCHNDPRTQPVPGTWPRLRDQGVAILREVQAKSTVLSESGENARCLLADPSTDLGAKPLWHYLSPNWWTGRYHGAAWGDTPVDCMAARVARLYPDTPRIYAAQRAYALARHYLSEAFAKHGIIRRFFAPLPFPLSGPGSVANPEQWYLARPITLDKMRLLLEILAIGARAQKEDGDPNTAELIGAHAHLVGLYKDVFITP